MTLMRTSFLSVFLCIALVITILPLIGAAGPASATRGYIHGTVTAADYTPQSPPIRGITVFIARADGSYSFSLRTNESGMYQSGTLDDRGVGFTVYANTPDKAGYNARYESASYDNVLFTVNDRDGELRDFALHGSSSGTPTPTATPTPSTTPIPSSTPTATPTTVIPTATPTATTTPMGTEEETGAGYEPDSPAAEQGYIHGTVRRDNINSGPGVNGLTVYVWRRDEKWSDTYTTYRNGGSDGYFNTGTLTDPTGSGYNVVVNKADQGGYKPEYTTSEHTNIHVSGNPPGDNHVIYRRSSPPPSSGTVSITVTVTDRSNRKLGGIPVVFWRKDGGDLRIIKTQPDSSKPDFGTVTVNVDKCTGTCSDVSKYYNIIANKWDDASRNTAWFNSTESVNIKPDGTRTLTFQLPTSKVTFSGRVYDETGKGVNGIDVYLWRHDDYSVYATTKNIGGTDGKWSIELDRSVWTSKPDHRFNIVANKNNAGHYNEKYTNSTEIRNVLPNEDKSSGLDQRIESRYVTLIGKVTYYDSSSRKTVPLQNIWLTVWRQDDRDLQFVTTGPDGRYSVQVEKFTGTCEKEPRCYNIAANKENFDPDHPKNREYSSKETSNVRPSYSPLNTDFLLDSGWVTFSGTLRNTTGAVVPDIWIYGWRQDNHEPFYAKTDKDGKWSVSVQRFSDLDKRYNVIANKELNDASHKKNARYLNTTEVVNVQPSYDRTVSLENIVVAKVTFSGKVSVSGKGVGGIPITFRRGDGAVTKYATTQTDGTFSILLDGCTSSKALFTVIPNEGGPGYPRKPEYTNPSPASYTNRWGDRDQSGLTFTLTGPAPTTTTPVPTTPPTPTITPLPAAPRITLVAAEMISPEELGIAVRATYPVAARDKARKITAELTINNRVYTKEFTVTTLTETDKEWGGDFIRSENGRDRVAPTTPLRLNLRELGVPRFTDDTSVKVAVFASYGSGTASPKVSKTITVLLPVIHYHGYLEWRFRIARDLWDGSIQRAAYEPFSTFLIQNGYNRDEEWGIVDRAQLALKGYSTRRYVTLLDTGSGVTYTTAEDATPAILLGEVQATVDRILSSSYAGRVNLVGHSTGGLVSTYYASVRPGNVARVITVGTPLEGVSDIYNKAFADDIRSRQQAEALLVAKNGPGKGQENTVRWFIPRYQALEVPGYVAGRDPNPYFTTSFTYRTNPAVDYHFVSSSSHANTPKVLVLEKNADGNWYHVKETRTTAGDGTVIGTSAGHTEFPESGSHIHRWPVAITETHAFMFKESSVQNAILSALKHAPASPLRDETANDR